MNDAAPAIESAFKERRNKAIEYHNASMQAVGHDKMLAYRLLCSAVTVDPSFAQGFYALGNACADLRMIPASIAAFRRQLELPLGPLAGDLNVEFQIKGMINLAHRLQSDGLIEEAYQVNEDALQLLVAHPDLDDEGTAFAATNMSLILSILGRDLGAIQFARRAFEQSKEPIIEVGLAFALMHAGYYAEGLARFEARFSYKPAMRSYLEYPYKLWAGEEHHGKTLFVPAEAGLGDTISFTRFIGQAARRVKRVIYAVQPELVRLLRASLKRWANVEVIPLTTGFPIADVWRAVGSLPVALDLSDSEIRDYPQAWQPQGDDPAPPEWLAPDRKLHIGIAWAGSPDNDIDRFRSIPFSQFLGLYRVPGVQLYSLQVGPHVADLHGAGAAALVRDLSPYIRDACDTVGLMRNLDLIIAAESFVPHLAAAAGKEVWIPLSKLGGDWRCGRNSDQPIWYPHTKLVRQGPDAQWQPVFDRIVEMLKGRVV